MDYVVHLANHYVESYHAARRDKMRDAFGEMGISIVGGAVTTVGAGLVLFGAQLLILNKFAILITSTIFFSLLFSLFFFGSLAHLLGPQGRVGSLLFLFTCCCRRHKPPSSPNSLPTTPPPGHQEDEGTEAALAQTRPPHTARRDSNMIIIEAADSAIMGEVIDDNPIPQ